MCTRKINSKASIKTEKEGKKERLRRGSHNEMTNVKRKEELVEGAKL